MKHLYKYASVGKGDDLGAIGYLLENQQLRFSPPNRLNDPDEAFPNIGAIVDDMMLSLALKAFNAEKGLALTSHTCESNDWTNQYYSGSKGGRPRRTIALQSAKEARAKVFANAGILSLTRTREQTTMWSHYADSHSGICVGFRSDARVFADSLYPRVERGGLHSVNYEINRINLLDDTSSQKVLQILTTKGLDWKYEEEVRALREIPIGENYLDVGFDPLDVKEIVLGCNMTPDRAKLVFDLHRDKYPHADLVIAVRNPEILGFVFQRCTERSELQYYFTDRPG